MAPVPKLIMAQALQRRDLLANPLTGEAWVFYKNTMLGGPRPDGYYIPDWRSIVADGHQLSAMLDNAYTDIAAAQKSGLEDRETTRKWGRYVVANSVFAGICGGVSYTQHQNRAHIPPEKLSELKTEARINCEKQVAADTKLAQMAVEAFHHGKQARLEFTRTAKGTETAVTQCVPQQFEQLKHGHVNGVWNSGLVTGAYSLGFAFLTAVAASKMRQASKNSREGDTQEIICRGNIDVLNRLRRLAKDNHRESDNKGMTAEEYEALRAESNVRWERYKRRVLNEWILT